jgi:hypothetical protein
VKVTVAVRDEAAVLAAAVSVIAVPEVPDAEDTETQVADDTADHWDWFVVTVTDLLPPSLGAVQLAGATDTVGGGGAAGCVTVTVAWAFPAVTVMEAVRDELEVVAAAVIVRAVAGLPDIGETESQVADEEADH